MESTATEVAIALGWMNTALLNYYVCAECGYVELFVQDRNNLPLIAKKYPKANFKKI